MEFDSTTLYIILGVCSIIAILLGYRILFPRLSLVGMAVYEAEQYMITKHKKLGVKVGFVQPTRAQYMFLGTIASHHTNPKTEAEDYVLYQIDIPVIDKPNASIYTPAVSEIPVTNVSNVSNVDLSKLVSDLPLVTPDPPKQTLPIIPEPQKKEQKSEPQQKEQKSEPTKKRKSETRLDMSYFW